MKLEIDEYSDKHIETLTQTQSERMELVKKTSPTDFNVNDTLKKDLKETIEKYDKMTINEDEFEKMSRRILELKFQCDKSKEESVLETDTLNEDKKYNTKLRDNIYRIRRLTKHFCPLRFW